MTYTNSTLVSYTKYSPNFSPGRKGIERITLHCVAAHASVESLGALFNKRSRAASSNYGIDDKGRIALFVDEKNRSWCSSSAENDNLAVTVEIASDSYHPYVMTQVAYDMAVRLCVDICKRYGKKRLIWIPDNNKALSYRLAPDEILLTVHRWFAAKACPGDWLYNRLGEVAYTVTAKLSSEFRIKANDLPIRLGPGTDHPLTRHTTGVGIFTIVEERNGWGKLKSGAGWIDLSKAVRI